MSECQSTEREKIFSRLRPIRTQLRLQRAARFCAWGVIASAVASMLIAGWNSAFDRPMSMGVMITVAVFGPLLGVMAGMLRPQSWMAVAECVDRRCQLRDRVTSALEFSAPAEQSTEFTRLQLRDADHSLSNVEASQVCPWKFTRVMQVAIVSASLAVMLYFVSAPVVPVQASTGDSGTADVAAALGDLERSVDELGDLASNLDDPELRNVAMTLQRQLGATKPDPADVRSALSTIAEMRRSVVAGRRQLSAELMDRQLAGLASAMSRVSAFESAGELLQKGQLAEAAEQLASMQQVTASPPEALAAAENLAKVAEAMKNAGFDQFAGKVSSLEQNLREQNATKAGRDSRQIADEIKRHQVRKDVKNALDRQLAQLSDARHQLQRSGACPICGGDCPPGQCLAEKHGSKSSTAVGRVAEQGQQSGGSQGENAGTAAGNDPLNEKTDLEATLQMARLRGRLSDAGSSERETVNVLQAEGEASRAARDMYTEYRKMSQAVVESEEIPPGRKRMIQRYFESIRPANVETN